MADDSNSDPPSQDSDTRSGSAVWASASQGSEHKDSESFIGDIVADSQCSDMDSPLQKHEVKQDCIALSSSQDSDDGFQYDKDLLNGVNLSADSPSPPTVNDDANQVKFKDFELGVHFDKDIIANLEKLENASEQTDFKLFDNHGRIEVSNATRLLLLSQLKRKVPQEYIEVVLKENNAHQFQDWHFIRESVTFEEKDIWLEFLGGKSEKPPISLQDLLISFGVPKPLLSPDFKMEDISRYDSMNIIVPVDLMCCELEKYVNDPNFTQYFILFILDRKIFDSLDCTPDWCTQMFSSLSLSKFMTTYINLVPRNCYYLHFRAIRQIPQIQELLLTCLFDKVDQEVLVTRLKYLLNAKRFYESLYFILVIYGSAYMPFGKTSVSEFLSGYISDMCDDGNHVELTIIKSYINLFMKIK